MKKEPPRALIALIQMDCLGVTTALESFFYSSFYKKTRVIGDVTGSLSSLGLGGEPLARPPIS